MKLHEIFCTSLAVTILLKGFHSQIFNYKHLLIPYNCINKLCWYILLHHLRTIKHGIRYKTERSCESNHFKSSGGQKYNRLKLWD